jgi:hypothetical protein
MPQFLDPPLAQGLRLRFVDGFLCNFPLRGDENLSHRTALLLMRAPFAFRNVLSAALLIFAVAVAPVVFVAQFLFLLRSFDLAHGLP